MPVKTCLLITDDPDDHQAFSEALSEISPKSVVLIVLDSEKALELLKDKKLIPDGIFLDLSMQGIRINTFLKNIKGKTGVQTVPTVIYGEPAGFEKIEDSQGLFFFDKDYQYSELKEFLSEFLRRLHS
jgi:CheY-like chemotaxis protein